MSHYLQTFKELLEKYLKGSLIGNEFYKAFSKYLYDETLKPQNAKEFNIIENLWGYLDIYEPNKKKGQDMMF
ncbi:hypothetical protein HYU07_06075 [Candidatus Woesearchaeota archaeon]|nr:hypothetical protein [Candidatus Woesearchaeota archaeon]